MALFENQTVLLELKNLPFKEKKRLKLAVTENGGIISFVVNNQCSLIVTGDVSTLSSSRLRSIHKHQMPVVGVEYVYSCLERGVFLPVDEYKLDLPSSSLSPPLLRPSSPTLEPLSQEDVALKEHAVTNVPMSKAAAEKSKGRAEPLKPVSPSRGAETRDSSGNVENVRVYTENENDVTAFPDKFQVAKYSIFEKVNSSTWYVLELQSAKGEEGQRYRVVTYRKDDVGAEKAVVREKLALLSTSDQALQVYQEMKKVLQAADLQQRSSLPLPDLGSTPFQQLLLEEKLNTGSLSQEVGVFVELLWTEALGCLGNALKVSINNLSLNDVSRAEGLLLQAQRKLAEENHADAASLLDEVYTLLPHREPRPPATAKLMSQKLDLCQLIRDVLNVSEMTLRSPAPSCLGKYRALRCSIETVPPDGSEFQAVAALLQHSRKLQIRQVLCVSRGVELQTFKSELGNIKPLLHSSSPSNFVGILSRGLLVPRAGVEHHGIERTDLGNLGSGIYFSDAMSTSLKYSKPSATDGSRLLLVCDVALGLCKDVKKRDPSLNEAPEGYQSVHGLRKTPNTPSEFEDDEYVVYSTDQVKLKYVVQFSIDDDQLKEFSPAVDTSTELSLPPADQNLWTEEDAIEVSKNPLDDVTAGLLDSSGQQLPLQAVHVKCKLMDLLSQVVIFQKYTNLSSVPIEAKYVFPLDDSAAVCGFEAFINGKHVVGQVKEKEKAWKEYKQAIEKGHGAYLMDQDAPDVFTISVGNLPPVSFVSELIVRDGSVFFSLPGSVAPWQQSAALNQTTQVTVEKVCVTDEAESKREFTLDMSIEMPHEITSLKCITHKIKIKRTDCKAVVSVLPGEVMGPDGFQLSFTLSEIHLPRMWVEKHPEKDSQACMLVFYPDFDVPSDSRSDEVVILLDSSESMKGESLRLARRIALNILRTLDRSLRLSVISFGTDHTEIFLTAEPLDRTIQNAMTFIKYSPPVGGSTELWRPLRTLSLLPPSRGLRNLLLLSDGHVQNPELTLKLLRDNVQHSRLFTCGLSPTANRHMLRALAQAGGGTYEFFDTKTKHNWTEKVARQVKRMASPGCSSASVKWQQFNPTAPPAVQAPAQLHALFNDCHTLVFGFVPHCTQATLHGNLSGQELRTMVSTSELQKTKGTFLHKLTARAIIRDYEDGNLETNEAEHEGKKAELKSFIIELSKEFSILSQFTSFVAIEERHPEQTEEGVTDIPKLIAEEDVDFLPYISWISPQEEEEQEEELCGSVECDFDLLSCFEESHMKENLVGLQKASLKVFEIQADADDDDVSRSYSATEEEEEEEEEEDLGWGLAEEENIGEEYPPVRTKFYELRKKRSVEMYSDTAGDISLSCGPSSLAYSPHVEGESSALSADVTAGQIGLEHPMAVTEPPDEFEEEPLLGRRGMKRMTDKRAPRSVPVCSPPPPADLIQPYLKTKFICVTPYHPPPPSPPTLPARAHQPDLLESHPVLRYHPEFCSESSPTPRVMHHDLAPAKPTPETTRFSADSSPPPPPPPPPPPLAHLPSLPLPQLSLPATAAVERKSMPIYDDLGTPPPRAGPRVLLNSLSHGPAFAQPASLTTPFSADSCPPPPPPPPAHLQPLPVTQQSLYAIAAAADMPMPIDGTIGNLELAQQASLTTPFSADSCPPPPPLPFIPLQAMLDRPFSLFSSPGIPVVNQGFGFGGTMFGSSGRGGGGGGGEGGGAFVLTPDSEPVFGFQTGRVCSTSLAQPFKRDKATVASSGPTDPPAGASVNFVSLSSATTERKIRKVEDLEGVEGLKGFGSRAPLLDAKVLTLSADEETKKKSDPLTVCLPAPEYIMSLELKDPKLKWMKIFKMQHSDGYWELTADLGRCINVDVDAFANVFLKNKGISSLGVRAHADILRLVATLLVLQLMRVEKLEEGKLLRTLFCLHDLPEPRPERWDAVRRAVDWVCWADWQYPCVYSRLEFGWSWESSTRQLLGYESPSAFSPLRSLNLQRNATALQVH
ncbi:hypothetical protein LDENG_00063780 [Lucifuga dentata]|nr:hypothetical protein LDENG_00063780 [Lucifuga dentata]